MYERRVYLGGMHEQEEQGGKTLSSPAASPPSPPLPPQP